MVTISGRLDRVTGSIVLDGISAGRKVEVDQEDCIQINDEGKAAVRRCVSATRSLRDTGQ